MRIKSTLAGLALLAVGSAGVLGFGSVSDAAPKTATAVFAGGCFWAMEAAFDQVKGVIDTTSGYAGGTIPNPTYGNHKGYKEAVRVTYDPSKVTYAQLLSAYWHNTDPFDGTGQFCDQAPPYQPVIFTDNAAEKALAEKTKAEIATRFHQKVATKIEPRTTFTPAEGYHQNYHLKHPAYFAQFEWGCGQPQRLKQIWGAPGRS
jgi:peptide-methionine (S)-S-oxide reductase